MLPTGELQLPTGHRVAIEATALRSLVSDHSSVLPRAGEVMSLLPPQVRAEVWNAQVPSSLTSAARMLRTRVGATGARAAFAAVSPGYTSLDADQIAGLVSEALARTPGGAEARGEVRYDPGSTDLRIDLVWHAQHTHDFAAGDVFRFLGRVRSHDGGGGAIRVEWGASRNRCYNLIIVSDSWAKPVRIVHRGSREDMVARFVRAFAEISRVAVPFLQRWGHARAVPVARLIENPSASPEVNALAVLRQIAGARSEGDNLPTLIRNALPPDAQLDTTGIERDVLAESLLSAWRAEPDAAMDVAALVNAVTRLHTERVPVPVLASAEAYGGALLSHAMTLSA